MKKNKSKVAIVISHPIQYQTPFFKLLASSRELELKIFFCSDWGLKSYRDSGFGQEVKWDIPLLEGYNYEFLKNISPLPNVSTFWGLINPQIVTKLKEENLDVIWVHGWARFTNWLCMLTALKLKIPILLRGESNLLTKATFLKQISKKLVFSWLFKRVSAFLAIGKYNAEFYEHYGVPKEKIFLVPYCTNNDFFISKADELIPKKKELKKKYDIPIELPIILFSGKLIDVKRPLDLLKAFEIVSREINAALVFVGDGNLRKDLENYVKENNIRNVYFMGFRNQTELPEFYAMGDVFVLPSELEPWGLVINEAMCFNLPIIVSKQVGASGDLVKDGVNGYICPSRNIACLEEKLRLILSNNDLMTKMGKSSREIISSWSYNEGINGVIKCLANIKFTS